MARDIRQFTVREAVLNFCFEHRVEDVNNAEHYFRSQEIVEFGYPPLGAASSRGDPTPCSPHELGTHRNALDAAWRNILLDLKVRIERGDLLLSAVQISPKLQERPEIIPGQWAMALRINPLDSTVWLKQTRYVNALLTPADQADAATMPSAPAKATAVTSIADMDADTIVALLEEYYRRATKDGVKQLLHPGKLTLMPLVKGKMYWRAERGELLPTLRTEARWLAAWIAEKATLHQVPSAPTIEKMLGSDYALLKPRSTPAI